MNITQLRAALAYVEAGLRDIHTAAEGRALDADEQTRWDEGVAYVDATRAQIADLEAREAVVAGLKAGTLEARPADGARSFHINVPTEPTDVLNDRSATPVQIADAISRNLEANDIAPDHARTLLKRHRGDVRWARNLLARSSDTYSEAFAKYATGREMLLTNEERAALSIGTNANGGFLLPTHLDPTVILTNAGSSNAVRQIARVVTLTEGSSWNGITSAGVTASFDATLTEVSDDSPNDFARPNIPVHKAQALVQASIEMFEDVTGLAGEVAMMLADARDRLEGAMHCTGSGTNQPTGIFTALDANTNVEVESTTAATIGLVDIHGLYRAVPVRFRGRGTWLLNPLWNLRVKELGTAVSASFTTPLNVAPSDSILGKPVVESDDAPSAVSTTVRDNEIIFGDFSNYVIVDKPGSTAIEFIPHLFNTGNNLPDGRRAWYMHFRSGADSVNDLAFRMLQDKTSA